MSDFSLLISPCEPFVIFSHLCPVEEGSDKTAPRGSAPMKANQPQWAFAKSRRWDLESWSALQDLEESTLIPFTNLSPSFCLVVVSGSNLEFFIFFFTFHPCTSCSFSKSPFKPLFAQSWSSLLSPPCFPKSPPLPFLSPWQSWSHQFLYPHHLGYSVTSVSDMALFSSWRWMGWLI